MVVVSHERRFIFLKTRKTAGTSIEMLLEGKIAPAGHEVVEVTPTIEWSNAIIGARSWWKDHPDEVPTNGWREHLPAKHVRELVGNETWDRYFRFTSVRNPFDRAVSYFFWQRQLDGLEPIADFDTARRAFHEFVASPKHKTDRGVVHIKGQLVVQDAVRFEHLEEDLDRVGKKIGLELKASELPRTKDSTPKIPGRHISEYYDRSTTDAVLDQLSWVFDHHDYSRHPEDAGRPPTRPAAVN